MDRLQLKIIGQVQGVGFRPHVYRVASALKLRGWVKNNGAGVVIEVIGENTKQFISLLQENLPPLAKIKNIEAEHFPYNPLDDTGRFEILKSESTSVNTVISPDVATCNNCLEELFNPESRFYLYPFLNCTHCGPRLTITQNLPYDRAQTSMDIFEMCEACVNDYLDPCNRRYHAQPTACQQCGPQLSMSLEKITQYILDGKILAIKSLGGFQLICDANNVDAIEKLRARKHRKTKPFALMALNAPSVQLFGDCSNKEKELLNSQERPIVLLKKKNAIFPDIIAPGLSQWGVMLPYTPFHYLLFYAFLGYPSGQDWLEQNCSFVLIVTSANPGKLPLVIDDSVAKSALKDIADHQVSYNRKIITRVDDSVVRVICEKPVFIRRARGYVPSPIKLSSHVPCTLALGAHLKNAFCITRGDEAFVSQHIGDIENTTTVEFLHESLNHLMKFLNVKPERIACDLHPDFYTTRLAHSINLPIIPVQHHHAHLTSVIAEYHIKEPVLGLALDGYGYGDDGSLWGGELFFLEGINYQRIGHFYPIALPGGDQATREPWRIALGILYELNETKEINKRFAEVKNSDAVLQMLEKNIHISRTSSCGRLFDAASALLGTQQQVNYEGEAAMKLESLVSQPEVLSNGWQIHQDQLNLLPTLKYLLNCDPVTGANIFHGTLIAGLADWLEKSCQQWKLNKVVLSGGCFLNKILTEGLVKMLMHKNIIAYFPKQVPPNDGGLCLGQAWVAAMHSIDHGD